MRKAFVIMVALVLLLGDSGCGSVPATHEEISLVGVANASNIAAAINEHNSLYLKSVLLDKTTLEEAKKRIGKYQWPQGLSDEEERTAWELIVIKDGEADLAPEAQAAAKEAREELRGPARDAYIIALAINAYDNLNPSAPLDCIIEHDLTLEDAKEAIWFGIWPEGLSDEEERAAWELIVYEDGEANLTPEAEQALRESSGDKSDEVKIANATMIVNGINVYNALNPNKMLPDNVTLAKVKIALEGFEFWPSLLTDAEIGEAWKLIEIKGGLASLTPEAQQAWQQTLREKYRNDPEQYKIINATIIANRITTYRLSNTIKILPDNATLAEVKEALTEAGSWPSSMTDAEEGEAWGLIELRHGWATVKGEG